MAGPLLLGTPGSGRTGGVAAGGGRAVPAEVLIDRVWGEDRASAAIAALARIRLLLSVAVAP